MYSKNEIIENYEEWNKENKNKTDHIEKETNKTIDNFLKLFDINSINNMSIDEYVVGKNYKKTFCYYLENRLMDAGNIKGTNAYKFGVFYSKSENKYKVRTPKFDADYNIAFDSIKSLIIDLIDSSKKHDIEAIANNKLSNMFKNKIVYLYNREDYLPIYAEKDVDLLLLLFQLPNNGKKEPIEFKKERLFNYYKSLGIRDCSPLRFMYFLYSDYAFKRILKSDVKKDVSNSDNKVIKTTVIEDLNDIFKEKDYENRKSTYKLNLKAEDHKKITGNRAEERVISYFEKNKNVLGITKIFYYCKKDNPEANDLAGCDIEYVKDGKSFFIEIKATSNNKKDKELFYMSDLEFNKMRDNRDNYFIYYFNNVFKDNDVKIIPAKLLRGKEHAVKYTFDLEDN